MAQWLRFGMGNPQVGISHTIPVPAHTVPVMGMSTYRTIIYMVSNGYLTDLVGGGLIIIFKIFSKSTNKSYIWRGGGGGRRGWLLPLLLMLLLLLLFPLPLSLVPDSLASHSFICAHPHLHGCANSHSAMFIPAYPCLSPCYAHLAAAWPLFVLIQFECTCFPGRSFTTPFSLNIR